MKNKILALVLCVTLSMSLVACGTAKETVAPEETETVESTEQEDAEEEVQEPEEDEMAVAEEEKGSEAEEEKDPRDEVGYNMFVNGDFNGSENKWDTYTTKGGTVSVSTTGGVCTMKVKGVGELDYSSQVFYDGLKVDQGVTYKLAFDISSTVPRTVVWRLQMNGGDYRAYFSEEFPVTEEMQHYEYEVTMEEPSDPAPRFCFNLGKYEQDGEIEDHNVVIDNIEFSVLDDSGKETGDGEDNTPDISVSQVGYLTKQTKVATFRGDSIGKEFEVIDTASKESVFKGSISQPAKNEGTQMMCATGDFSSVTKAGTYQIVSEGCKDSYEFVIGDDAYDALLKDTLKMLYLQRCGSELSADLAGDFAHGACHTGDAVIYGTDTKKEVCGGWHDAGDYGRYVVAGAKAVADLLMAYENYPQMFDDNAGILESGNGIPDVLDEARYELEWMLKMQDGESGGVYHKVTGESFPGTVLATEETEQMILSPISITATGDFAAVMAMAARIYADVDAHFADQCIQVAEQALSYVEANSEKGGFANPRDIVTGEYPDSLSADEHAWALAELYKTTGDSYYQDQLKLLNVDDIAGGLGWASVGYYAMFEYATCEDTDTQLAQAMTKRIVDSANAVLGKVEKDAYGSSIADRDYPWGSNMSIANNGLIALMDKQLSEKNGDNSKTKNLIAAQKQVAYLLGTNGNNYCFVTGYGSLSPVSTHHRPSQALGKTMKGMLVGGPNSNLEDPYAKAVLQGKPKALCYADNEQSYSCNEITIYWNSPLVYLLAGVMSQN